MAKRQRDKDAQLEARIAALEARLKTIEEAVGRLLSAPAKKPVKRAPRSTRD